MITLAQDCLIFKMAGGENIPFSAEMISIELMGESSQCFEPEFVKHAAKAVFHYFKHERALQAVTVAEFTEALEKVLRGFSLNEPPRAAAPVPVKVLESDLRRLANDSGNGCELFFFPRLRDELRHQLRQSPRAVRFHGLRPCVKQLIGTRRWGLRCQDLEDQIVAYLRECLGAESKPDQFSLLVE